MSGLDEEKRRPLTFAQFVDIAQHLPELGACHGACRCDACSTIICVRRLDASRFYLIINTKMN